MHYTIKVKSSGAPAGDKSYYGTRCFFMASDQLDKSLSEKESIRALDVSTIQSLTVALGSTALKRTMPIIVVSNRFNEKQNLIIMIIKFSRFIDKKSKVLIQINIIASQLNVYLARLNQNVNSGATLMFESRTIK